MRAFFVGINKEKPPMKKVVEFLKNWFEKNGLIKLLVSFVLLIISTLIVKNTNSHALGSIFNVIGLALACYLVLTVFIFTIAGIVNTVKDIFKKK